MRFRHIWWFIALLGCSLAVTGCAEDDVQSDENEVWLLRGTPTPLLEGEASAWVTMTDEQGLQRMGVTISPSVLMTAGHAVVTLQLPVEAYYLSLFDHVELEVATDNADEPYVALHFFAFDEEERRAITCGPDELPASDRVPHDLFIGTDGDCVPGRGYMALNAPGSPFGQVGGTATATVGLDYGAGEVAGIALLFASGELLSHSRLGAEIPGADGVERALMWPRQFEAGYHESTNTYEIELSDFAPVHGGIEAKFGD